MTTSDTSPAAVGKTVSFGTHPRAGGAASDEGKSDSAIHFPLGMPGFPEAVAFRIDPASDRAASIGVLRACDDSDLGFLIVPVDADAGLYDRDDLAQGGEALGADSADIQMLLVATLRRNAAEPEVFVNMRAPVFIDVKRRRGAQVVLRNPAYAVRHPLRAA